MQKQMDAIFDEAFTRFSRSDQFSSLFQPQPFSPELDFTEDDKHFVMKLDIPGADESDITVTLEGETLRIAGERTINRDERDNAVSERWHGRFERVFTLPGPVARTDAMETDYENGVLTIKVRKAM